MARSVVERGQKHVVEYDDVLRQLVGTFTVHDVSYRDAGGLWQPADEAIYDDTSVSGFVASALKTRHGVRFGSGGERRWYPRLGVAEYVEVGKPDRWDGSRWRVWNLTGLSRSGNRVTWETSTYRVEITNLWRRVKLSYTLKTTSAYTRVRYPITLSGLSLNETTGALTSQSDGQVVGWIDKPTAEDANGATVTVTQEIAGGYTELVVTPGSAVYPITVDPTLTDGYDSTPNTAKDNTVGAGGNAANNSGTLNRIHTRGPAVYKGLVEFDLSSIAASATCDSATLYTYKYFTGTDVNTRTCTVYSIGVGNAAWVEGTKSNTQAGAGEPCWNALAADGVGGVTTAWIGSAGLSTSGTDYEADALGTWTFTENEAAGTEKTCSLSTSRVAGWFGASNTNYGLVWWSNAGASDQSAVCSSDHATTGYRPKLVVVYTLPTTLRRRRMLRGVGR